MASSTTIDVDYDIDKEDGGMDTLDFQDIPHSSGGHDPGKTHEFTNFPHSAVDSDEDAEEDSAKLLNEEKPVPSSSFWTFAYYQQFFNVETKQVGLRIVGSMLPKPGSNYLVKEIRPNPDLYGPFWICTTLVFTTAIAGNLANYFSSAGQDYHWHYDFHKVTFAATAIFSYWWLIPLILFGLMWWKGYKERFSFLEMICVYGYSLAIYIPISILWAIQVTWLQWMLVVVGAVLSGSVLLLTFWPPLSEGSRKIAIGVMIFIFVMHAALAAGFVLYFFHVPATAPVQPAAVTNTTAVPATKPHLLSKGKETPVKAVPDVSHNQAGNDIFANKGNQNLNPTPPTAKDVGQPRKDSQNEANKVNSLPNSVNQQGGGNPQQTGQDGSLVKNSVKSEDPFQSKKE